MNEGVNIKVGGYTQFNFKMNRTDEILYNQKCCNVEISVNNEFFNYDVNGKLVESELYEIITDLSKFINGEIYDEMYSGFYMGELELEFHESDNNDPDTDAMVVKLNIVSQKYVREGYFCNINDYYCLLLNRKEAKQLYDYLMQV